jgi:hypothetical protein
MQCLHCKGDYMQWFHCPKCSETAIPDQMKITGKDILTNSTDLKIINENPCITGQKLAELLKTNTSDAGQVCCQLVVIHYHVSSSVHQTIVRGRKPYLTFCFGNFQVCLRGILPHARTISLVLKSLKTPVSIMDDRQNVDYDYCFIQDFCRVVEQDNTGFR